jgi:molecular chaperone HtpG
MKQGNLSVHTENIFPIIKKFLYSDHEIFLRELVSNAVDATQKLKTLASSSEFNEDLGDLTIEVSVDKEAKTITIADKGIGMSAEDVEKYINQIAFSGAEEFVQKYADKTEGNAIIGHFGLGFYSAFMVAKEVSFTSQSYKSENPSVQWDCNGNIEYTLTEIDKRNRGTTITLHVSEDSLEFLEDFKIEAILKKYGSFLPIPIKFKDNIINENPPIWTKKPSELTDEDYQKFYEQLYPFSEKPLFHIHLNIDYPFNLTGILYFPKWKESYDLNRSKIQLYSNNVFITDDVKDIVPEYLTLLHGVIDSPDIPLNVSRSYLQSDGNVKKISGYISKKVSDKLAEIFKNDRPQFEEKWDDLGFFIKYGILADEKFWEKAKDYLLVKNIEDKKFTIPEYEEFIQASQKDKNDTLNILYTNDPQSQDTYITSAQRKGYDVLIFDQPIDNHFIQSLESKLTQIRFKRIDSDVIDKLIEHDVNLESILSKEEEESLVKVFQDLNIGQAEKFNFKTEALSPEDMPISLTQNEFMRRMTEMSKLSGGSNMFGGGFPMNYDVVINSNHPLSKKIIDDKNEEDKVRLATYLFDLAKLNQNLLKGKDLTNFINTAIQSIK